ncbi:Aldo-keto reductase [Mycena chlorophos]|uniref:Aldo-keto reductase n=1 Tax=Mycena chlorophos TaxID=658473 RepID=A0A8H6TJ85_MYCCL|nr:Aldo-keto reductase [Mycena chlorophos]
MAPIPSVKLSSGYDIPILGLGTWQSKPEEVTSAVEYALKEAGIRHIDCAQAYGNEKDVGAGIAASGIPRSEVFITSKVWTTYMSRVEEALDLTLANLGTDYLDRVFRPPTYLYPLTYSQSTSSTGPSRSTRTATTPSSPPSRTESATSSIRGTSKTPGNRWKSSSRRACPSFLSCTQLTPHPGKVRSIGVSNFSQTNLDKILPTATIPPAVNQLELHVYNPQHKLLAYLRANNIRPQAYSPLGSAGSPLFTDEVVVELAKKHGVEPSDVLLGYLLANDVITLPKSVTPARIKANATGPVDAWAKFSKEDITQLDGLAAAGKQKRFIMPPWPVDLGFDNWG